MIISPRTILQILMTTILISAEIMFAKMWGIAILNSQIQNIIVLTLGMPILFYVYKYELKFLKFINY